MHPTSIATLERATASDAVAVSSFLAEPLPGAVRLSIVPEPVRCAPRRDQESRHHAIVVRDASGRVIAHGARTVLRLRVAGEPQWIGYLHGLRRDRCLAGDGRRLARGLALLASTHEDDEATYDLTSILESNDRARRVLEGDLGGAPRYRFIGGYRTAIAKASALAMPIPVGYSVRTCDSAEVDELQSFVDRNAADFAPVANIDRTRSDWILLRHGSQLIGCVRRWDRRNEQRISVASYAPLLSIARPFVNAGLWSARRPSLPRPGRNLAMAYAAHLTCIEPDLQLTRCLIGAVAEASVRDGCDMLAIGLGEGHPLRPLVDLLPAYRLHSRLYAVGGRPLDVYSASPEAALL